MIETEDNRKAYKEKSKLEFYIVCVIYGPALVCLKFGIVFSFLYLIFAGILVKKSSYFQDRWKHTGFRNFILLAPLVMLSFAVAKELVFDDDLLDKIYLLVLLCIFVMSIVFTKQANNFIKEPNKKFESN